MTTDLSKLAASLTDAQRDGLISGWGSVGISRALKRKGLSSGYLGNDPGRVVIVETQTGRALRAYLERNPNG